MQLQMPVQRVSASGDVPRSMRVLGGWPEVEAALSRVEPSGWRVAAVTRLSGDCWNVLIRPVD